MSGPPGAAVDVRLAHRVHQGLSIDVAFRLDREIGVVFGPSGAGKTTLLRLIAGLTAPNEGHVRLGGETLFDAARRASLPLRRRRLGLIFQDDCLFPHLNVAANIGFGLKGWRRAEAADRLAEVAELCGVGPLMARAPAALSGGERQRVGLARALAPRPRLLLCDEPVSALDLPNRHALLERLRAVQRAEAVPVLYVTHSVAEAVAIGTRVLLMDRGRIVAEGPPLEILGRASGAGAGPGNGAGDAAAFGPLSFEGVLNIFPARVDGHVPERGASRLALIDGPMLTVPRLDRPDGARAVVAVRADDVLLARWPCDGLSARNQFPGVVERIVPHGAEAEVVVRTGGVLWIVSVVAPALEQLELRSGAVVHLIVKARSCRVLDD